MTTYLDAQALNEVGLSGIAGGWSFASQQNTGGPNGQNIAAGQTYTMLDWRPFVSGVQGHPQYTGKPGFISELKVTGDTWANVQNSIITVYIDGEAAPSLSFDLANLGMANVTRSGLWWAGGHGGKLTIETGSNSGTTNGVNIIFTYPIPFKSTAVVNLTAPTSGGFSSFLMAHVQTGKHLGIKLLNQCQTLANIQSYTATQQLNGSIAMLNVPSGPGWIAAQNVIWQGTDQKYLEQPVVAWLNLGRAPVVGTDIPQYQTSGGEDGWASGWYFAYTYQGSASTPGAYVGNTPNFFSVISTTAKTTAFVDFADRFRGGIPFQNGAYMAPVQKFNVSNTGTISTVNYAIGVNASIAWNTFYYVPYPLP